MADPDRTELLTILMQEFTRAGIRELHLRHGDFEIYLSNDAAAGRYRAVPPNAAMPAMPPPPVKAVASRVAAPAVPAAAAAPLPEGAVIVTAPNLGTFYRAPKPGAANYVEIGSRVAAGDELCLIEVMKLFTALKAEISGTIHAVLVEDGAMVEGGQPLFALTRD